MLETAQEYYCYQHLYGWANVRSWDRIDGRIHVK